MNSEFAKAIEVADKITKLLEETVAVESEKESGTLTFDGNTVHVSESGVHRVTAGVSLIYSGTDVKEAVIEAVIAAISSRTKEILRNSL